MNNKITTIVSSQKTENLGRIVISLDDLYVMINKKKYDITKAEYNYIKLLVENKLTNTNITSNITNYDSIKIEKDVELEEIIKDEKVK